MIKVSIIIPVYNVASYVEQCIGSCVGQTFGDIEIIVVNDGSTDSSPQLIERYAAKDERIVVINKTKNEGLIYAAPLPAIKRQQTVILFIKISYKPSIACWISILSNRK